MRTPLMQCFIGISLSNFMQMKFYREEKYFNLVSSFKKRDTKYENNIIGIINNFMYDRVTIVFLLQWNHVNSIDCFTKQTVFK